MGPGSFPGIKRPGRGVNHPSPSSAWVEERVKLYLYFPSVPSWAGYKATFTFFFLNYTIIYAARYSTCLFLHVRPAYYPTGTVVALSPKRIGLPAIEDKKYIDIFTLATRYGLDGPGIESRWGDEIFRTIPDWAWGSPSFL